MGVTSFCGSVCSLGVFRLLFLDWLVGWGQRDRSEEKIPVCASETLTWWAWSLTPPESPPAREREREREGQSEPPQGDRSKVTDLLLFGNLKAAMTVLLRMLDVGFFDQPPPVYIPCVKRSPPSLAIPQTQPALGLSFAGSPRRRQQPRRQSFRCRLRKLVPM
ncbi:hypothetical protein BHE74_00048719 [Ensete ventricosum]|nr:hypothetical protein BHE74_00048719 [Ensete ventricosum]